jgi:hypothetical protein
VRSASAQHLPGRNWHGTLLVAKLAMLRQG